MNAHEIKNKTSEKFSEWAEEYDRSLLQGLVFRQSHDMFLSQIKSHPEIDKLRVLDVGCGTGKFISSLLDQSGGIKLDGVDISPDMIKVASSKFEKDNVNFKVGDVENLPYENSMFDIVTCCHSFHHYPDQRKAVSEMYRVLKKTGKLMIVDGCRDGLRGRIIFGLVIKRFEKDVYHILARELQEMFKVTGFKEVFQKVFNPLIPLLFTVGTKE
ncbi:MAG: class I SAM-dependent methyltransferase [Candidatus Omnitrophota bacterium]